MSIPVSEGMGIIGTINTVNPSSNPASEKSESLKGRLDAQLKVGCSVEQAIIPPFAHDRQRVSEFFSQQLRDGHYAFATEIALHS